MLMLQSLVLICATANVLADCDFDHKWDYEDHPCSGWSSPLDSTGHSGFKLLGTESSSMEDYNSDPDELSGESS